MDHSPAESLEPNQLLDELVTAYLKTVEAGQTPDRQQWFAQYPQLASDLAEFFADQDRWDRMTSPMRAALGPPSITDDTPLGDGNKSAAELRLGSEAGSFGDYELLAEIGRGGMGIVYKARQGSLGRVVALKMLRGGSRALASDVHRFRVEAEAAAGLDHPHIVPIYEIGTLEGQPYFSMKLLSGGNLADAALRGPASAGSKETCRRAAQWVATVARAVHHAHQHGILHRDLKPSNILLDAEGRPHVTDFGLAKRVEVDSSLTQSGMLIGTPSYMAPEQATGRKGAITTATDVYGLGAILYALLTGRPPFRGETVLDTLTQVKERDPEPLSASNGRIDRNLETICLKCLQKDPQQRYRSAELLAEDLERWLAGKPIRARRSSIWEQTRKWVRRRPVTAGLLAVTSVAVLILVVGLGWVVRGWQARRTETEARVVEALQAAESKLRDGNPRDPELIAATRKAEAQLAGGVVRSGLQHQVEQLLADIKLLENIEEIRLRQAAVKERRSGELGFDWSGSDPAYAQAFRDYGIDVQVLGVQEAATRIRQRAIAIQLAAALDDWALSKEKAGLDNWKELLDLARQADPDPWRCALREARATGNKQDLEKVLASAPIQKLPPATLALVGKLAQEGGKAAKLAVAVLREGQQHYPADFWINHELAYCLAQIGQPGEAIRFYSVALALRPQSPGVYVNLGRALQDKGALDEAVAAFKGAIRLKPDYADAHDNLGAALAHKGALDEAIAAFKEAIRLKPDHASAYSNLGTALGEKGALVEAIGACKEAIRIRPKYAPAHNGLGIAFGRKGALNEAIAAFKEAIHLKPDFADAYNNLGNAVRLQGALDEAIVAYKEAIRLKPDCVNAYDNLGSLLQQTGRRSEAEQMYRQALLLQQRLATEFSDILAYRNRLGAMLHKLAVVLEDRTEARCLLEQALAHQQAILKVDPNNPCYRQNLRAHLNDLSETLVALGAHSDAARVATGMPQHFPEDWEAYTLAAGMLARCMQLADKDTQLTATARQAVTEAYRQQQRQLLELAVQRGADKADAHNTVAWLLATSPDPRIQDPKQAILLAKKALTIAPENANCWNTLGTAYFRAQQWKEAVAALEKSMELHSGGDSFDWFFLAMVHQQLGKSEKARHWYDRAVEWMEKHKPQDEELRRFRAEAAALLGIREEPVNKHSTNKQEQLKGKALTPARSN